MRDTVVVVPCYNEANRLDPEAFRHALAQEPALRFVMVDDGSQDRTAAILNELAADWEGRVLPLVLERNRGKAEAVRQGMLYAGKLAPELFGFWDADLSTPLRFVPRLAARFDDEKLLSVIGSRVQMLGTKIERYPARHYIGRFLATIAALALRSGVYDTQCGAKLFRCTPAALALFAEPFELNWFFDVEILARLQGLSPGGLADNCAEVVLDSWFEAPGSKITARQFHRVASEILRLPGVVERARTRNGSTQR